MGRPNSTPLATPGVPWVHVWELLPVNYRHASLVLEDGSRFTGVSFGYEQFAEGELVFNTGMVGYPENLTDPSYKGQFLVSTYPIVGNYGVPDESQLDSIGLPEFMESDRVHVSAFIVQDYSHHHSHWNSRKSLSQWLTEQRVPALYGIDTRALTKRIRDRGAMLAGLSLTGPTLLGAQVTRAVTRPCLPTRIFET